MNSAAFAAKQARRAQAAVHSFAQGIVFLTRVSATSADGGTDADEGWTSDDAPQQQQTARRMEPWGLHGRPVTGILSAVLRVMGGVASGLRVGYWTGGHGRQNLDVGETQLYCKVDGCEVWLGSLGDLLAAAAANRTATLQASGTGKAKVTASAVTGAVELGPNPIAQVLVVGAMDSMGVPVTQLPAAALSIVKSG